MKQVEVRQGLLLVVRNGSNELVMRANEAEDLSFWADRISDAVRENGKRRIRMMEARAANGEVCGFGQRSYYLVVLLCTFFEATGGFVTLYSCSYCTSLKPRVVYALFMVSLYLFEAIGGQRCIRCIIVPV